MKYAFYCFAKILTFYKPTSSFFHFFQIIFISLIIRIIYIQIMAKKWSFISDNIVIRSKI